MKGMTERKMKIRMNKTKERKTDGNGNEDGKRKNIRKSEKYGNENEGLDAISPLRPNP